MQAYIHRTSARIIKNVEGYYAANMDLLVQGNRATLFPADRPVRTKTVYEMSTFYGENARNLNSLVADNCRIEGSIENCIIFPGVTVEAGAEVKNSIIMKNCRIGKDADLDYVIADKNVVFTPSLTLTGSAKLPIVVPKFAEI